MPTTTYLRSLFSAGSISNDSSKSWLFGTPRYSSRTHDDIELSNNIWQESEEKLRLVDFKQTLFASLSSRGLAFCFGLTPIIYTLVAGEMSEGSHFLDPLANELPWVIPVVIVFNMIEQYLLITKKHQLELQQRTLEAIKDLSELEKRVQIKHVELIRAKLGLTGAAAEEYKQAILAIQEILKEIRTYRKRLTYSSFKQACLHPANNPAAAPAAPESPDDLQSPVTPSGNSQAVPIFYHIDTLETLWLLRENFYGNMRKTINQHRLLADFTPRQFTTESHNLGFDQKYISTVPLANSLPLTTSTPAAPIKTWLELVAFTPNSNEERVEFIKRVISPISRAIWPVTLIITYSVTGNYLGAIFGTVTFFSTMLAYWGLAKPIYDKKKEQQRLTKQLNADVTTADHELRLQRQINSVCDFMLQLSMQNNVTVTPEELDVTLNHFDKERDIYNNSEVKMQPNVGDAPTNFYSYCTWTTLAYLGQGALALLMIATTFGAGSSLCALANKAEVEQITDKDTATGIGWTFLGISLWFGIRDLANNWRNIHAGIVQSHDLTYKEKCVHTKINLSNSAITAQNLCINQHNAKYANNNAQHPLFIKHISLINEQSIRDKFAQDNPNSLLGNTKRDMVYTAMKGFKKGLYKAARATSYVFFLSAVISWIPVIWPVYAGVFAGVFLISTAEYIVKRVNRQHLDRRKAILETKERAIERKHDEIEAAKIKIAKAREKLGTSNATSPDNPPTLSMAPHSGGKTVAPGQLSSRAVVPPAGASASMNQNAEQAVVAPASLSDSAPIPVPQATQPDPMRIGDDSDSIANKENAANLMPAPESPSHFAVVGAGAYAALPRSSSRSSILSEIQADHDPAPKLSPSTSANSLSESAGSDSNNSSPKTSPKPLRKMLQA